MKRLFILPLITVLLTLNTGCFENKKYNDIERLLGSWKWTNKNEENMFIFYENFSFYSRYIHLSTGEEHKGWGSFSFEDKKLCMHTTHGASGGEESRCYDYIFSENNKKLTLITEEKAEIILIKLD